MDSVINFLKTNKFKKYFYNTGWGFVERVVSLLLAFFVTIIVARYLGPERFGILNYTLSICALAGPLCFLGLQTISTRELIKHPEQRNEIIGTSFFLMLGGCLTAFALILALSFFIPGDHTTTTLLRIIGFSLIFDSFLIYKYLNEATVRIKYTAISTIISFVISYSFQILLVFLKAPLIWFGLAILLQKALLAIGLYLFYQNTEKIIHRWQFNITRAKQLLSDSWPLLLSGFAIIIYMKIDQVMLKFMVNNVAVGEYAAAVRISEIWYFIPIIICHSVFPAIISAKKTSIDLYRKRLKQLYKLMSWTALSISITTTFLAPYIIKLLYGSAYVAAISILKIHIWASLFVFLGVASGKYLLAENLNKLSMIRTIIGMISNIILNFLLIPLYGTMGAAIATLISYFISVFSIFYIKEVRGHLILLLKSLI